jgi:hypothetical protein
MAASPKASAIATANAHMAMTALRSLLVMFGSSSVMNGVTDRIAARRKRRDFSRISRPAMISAWFMTALLLFLRPRR